MTQRRRPPCSNILIPLRIAIVSIFLFCSLFFPNPNSQNHTVNAAACTPGGAIRTGFVLPNTLGANDDGSAPLSALGFDLRYFGQTFSSIYINNNGNITFDAARSSFTPSGMMGTAYKILAPFFADVDTRGSGSGLVQYGQVPDIDGHKAFVVNWPGVGYYSNGVNKLNTFQLVIIQREDLLPAGQWDFEFNYGQVQWETGSASNGINGLGGISAAVGYTDGVIANPDYYEVFGTLMPGSFLDSNTDTGLIHNSRESSQCGRYSFAVRGPDGIPDVDPLPEIQVNSDSPDPSEAGLPYSVIVQVNPEPDAAIPTGTVMVSDGRGKTCEINLVAGMGSCSLISDTIGSLELMIAYSGDSNYSPNRTTEPHEVEPGHGPVVVAGSNTYPANGSTINKSITQLKVAFNKEVEHDGKRDSADNPDNYILVEANGDGFQTTGCFMEQNISSPGLEPIDSPILISSIFYDNNGGDGPFVATLTVPPLSTGSYRLIICGTATIRDMLGNALNDGETDTIIDFSITTQLPSALPKTGFAPNAGQVLGPQPVDKQYQDLHNLEILIPSLDVKALISGVPVSKDGWDVTWLGKNTGWLTGTAYPTWEGNSVITGHVWTATNTEGPFAHLKELAYGDEININAWGQVYVYEVRDNLLISANDLSAVMKHKSDHSWLTLLTCEDYSSEKENYMMRRIVRAVLIETK